MTCRISAGRPSNSSQPELLGQRQVVRIVGRRQTEGVGKDKRLKVQPRGVVEFDAETEEVTRCWVPARATARPWSACADAEYWSPRAAAEGRERLAHLLVAAVWYRALARSLRSSFDIHLMRPRHPRRSRQLAGTLVSLFIDGDRCGRKELASTPSLNLLGMPPGPIQSLQGLLLSLQASTGEAPTSDRPPPRRSSPRQTRRG